VANLKTSRKRRFRAALALDGLTMNRWADKNGITGSYVSAVLAGRMESLRLLALIDEYTEKTLATATVAVA
jgi:hypothetical protein